MDKRGLLGKIIIALVIVVVLIVFFIRYIGLEKGNVAFTSPEGTVKINIDYNNTQEAETISPPISPPYNQTNQSQQSLNNSFSGE